MTQELLMHNKHSRSNCKITSSQRALRIPRAAFAQLLIEIPDDFIGEAVLTFRALGLCAGCNLEVILQTEDGSILFKSRPNIPNARIRTSGWRYLFISVLRRFYFALRLEALIRSHYGMQLSPLCYQLPAGRLSGHRRLVLRIRRILTAPVLVTDVKFLTSTIQPQMQIPHDSALDAYPDQWSIVRGDPIHLRVHSIAGQFDLIIVRYGASTEVVQSVKGIAAAAHTRPRSAYLYGAHWPVARAFATDPGWKPGLYGLRLHDSSERRLTVPVILRAREPQANLLVISSTNTWAAYNEWGGASLYHWRNPDALGREYASAVTRARPNPFADPDRGPYHLAHGLATLLRWIERAGYVYDIIADEDLHAEPRLLQQYTCVVLDCHAEYWTSQMYDGLRSYLTRGGACVDLSGNGLYWKTHLSGDLIEVAKPSGVLSNGEAGGLWSDLGRSESSVRGIAYTSTGSKTYAPYRVLQPDHWLFRGTGVRLGSIIGAQGAWGAASGHETDKINRHTPAKTVVLAKGLNPRGSGADMVWVERPDGGRVFAVGSITFTGALESDPVLDRVMRNALNYCLGVKHS